MKTKLFSLFAALLFAQAMMGQFHIGAKAGANIIKIEGKSFKDQFRYGYHAGGFAEIGLGGKLGIQPEVMFNQYTTKIDSNFSHVYQNVFKQGNVKLIGNFLSLQAGPQFSVLIQQSETLLQNGANAFKNGDFSMVGGAQVKVGPLRFNGRYVVGLNNINDIDNQEKWKSQGFQLSAGIAL